MSCKLSINNSIKLNNDPQQWVKGSSIDSSIKLAGEEAKDRLYEPKHKKKLVRVLTVVAYVFFVSLAAIMLSLYYVFLWNGNQKDTSKPSQESLDMENSIVCDKMLVDIAFEPTAIPVMEATVTTKMNEDSSDEIVEEDTSWPVEQNTTKIETAKIRKRSPLLEKLFDKHILN